MSVIPFQVEVEYPDSDGQPIAESEVHMNEMFDLIAALRRRYRDTSDIYVGGNLFLYYRQGDPRAVVAPDVFFVRGVARGIRKTFKLWEEGVPPCFIVDVTSGSTKDEDLRKKKALYEQLGVEEYFLHDPEGDYLSPRLQGFRLFDSRYTSIRPNSDGSLESRTTGLTLRTEGKNLRLIDTVTSEPLLWVEEVGERLREAESLLEEETSKRKALQEQAKQEAAARKSLEEEIQRLRAELKR